MFDEPYISKFGYEIEPERKIPVLIDLSIVVDRVEYTESRMEAVVTLGSKGLSTHYGDGREEVIEAATTWIYKNFRIPDSYTFYTPQTRRKL